MGTTPPGRIRDSILGYLGAKGSDASLDEIHDAVRTDLGLVAPSSVRSYLNLNTPQKFIRTAKGRYAISRFEDEDIEPLGAAKSSNFVQIGRAKLYTSDCMSWLASQPSNSIHAVITDPPYGIREYSAEEQGKLRSGKGGMWRIPPSFDGHLRSPLPRFTVLDDDDRAFLLVFFKNLARLLHRVVVPGGNIAVASNPLLAHIVSSAFTAGGFEIRGSVVRLTMTMRGGDRPKNAHAEFSGVSVMPRSMWEP